MEIRVEHEPTVTAQLDLIGFENEMKTNFDIERAVKNNLKITQTKINEPERIKNMIYLCTDWGQILKLYGTARQTQMTIYINKVQIRDMVRYTPSTLNTTNLTFKFQTENYNSNEYMITHTFIPLIEHHFENLIRGNILNYVNTHQWIPLFKLD